MAKDLVDDSLSFMDQPVTPPSSDPTELRTQIKGLLPAAEHVVRSLQRLSNELARAEADRSHPGITLESRAARRLVEEAYRASDAAFALRVLSAFPSLVYPAEFESWLASVLEKPDTHGDSLEYMLWIRQSSLPDAKANGERIAAKLLLSAATTGARLPFQTLSEYDYNAEDICWMITDDLPAAGAERLIDEWISELMQRNTFGDNAVRGFWLQLTSWVLGCLVPKVHREPLARVRWLVEDVASRLGHVTYETADIWSNEAYNWAGSVEGGRERLQLLLLLHGTHENLLGDEGEFVQALASDLGISLDDL